jgi:hypothetical protein
VARWCPPGHSATGVRSAGCTTSPPSLTAQRPPRRPHRGRRVRRDARCSMLDPPPHQPRKLRTTRDICIHLGTTSRLSSGRGRTRATPDGVRVQTPPCHSVPLCAKARPAGFEPTTCGSGNLRKERTTSHSCVHSRASPAHAAHRGTAQYEPSSEDRRAPRDLGTARNESCRLRRAQTGSPQKGGQKGRRTRRGQRRARVG